MEPKDKFPLNAVEQREYYPLTFNQLGIWLLHQASPGDPVLNMGTKTRLKGTLRVDKLAEALTGLMESNATPRTRFIIVKNEPYQVISPDIKPGLTYIDLTDRLKFEREVEARILIEREGRQPFDLYRGPLIRFMLIRLEQDEHLLLFNMHHIISDATTLNLIWEKLISLYNGLIKTGAMDIHPMKINYHDFAVWQHRVFKDDYFKPQEEFWQQEFPGKVPQVTTFPIDLKTRSTRNYDGRTYEKIVDPGLAASLKKFSSHHKVNLFTTLLAAFYILLHKLTGQEDLVIGAFLSARQNHPGLFYSIGWLINVLPLRIRINPGQTVVSFLKSLKEKITRVYLHQDYPLLKLIRKINPQRFTNRSPLFQVVFNMVPGNLPNTPMTGLTAGDREYIETQTSQYDLTVFIFDRPTELKIKFEYSTNLYKRESIIKRMEHYLDILRKMQEDPGGAIEKEILSPGEKQGLAARRDPGEETPIEIITQAERHRVIYELNRTTKPYPRDKTIYRVLEEQGEKTPAQTAVVGPCVPGKTGLDPVQSVQTMTYRELHEKSNRQARWLRQKNVKANTIVGVMANRSLETITAILAILKAGGAYLPIDPGNPSARITTMLEDSKVSMVLTNTAVKENQTLHTQARDRDFLLLNPGLESGEWEKQPAQDLEPHSGPGDLIYVIFTSGSTGKPKGAGIMHRGFMNLMHWFVTEFGLENENNLLLTSLGFDLTQKNLYAPLMKGGTLYFTQSQYFEPLGILREIHDNHIDWINCTPSMGYKLVEYEEISKEKKMGGIRYIFLGGEPISMTRLIGWLESPNCHAQIVNTYGPTECTDICSSYRVTDPRKYLAENVPIGKPIDNVQLYVMDKNARPLPVGKPGELWIGGEGVGIGYLEDPAMTGEKFILHSFAPGEPGQRLYRTGDLVKRQPGGTIEFLGRIDNQVKIRGYRIELEEIENTLIGTGIVKETAVGIEEEANSQTGPRLIAYLVLKPGLTPTKTEIIDRLKTRLPEYMIPADFVILDRLCYTGNGKLDRKALSAQQHKKLEVDDKFIPPSTPIERSLAKIWAEALGIEKVGTRDNFFNLGGHSLLASQIILQVREEFGVDISLLALFGTPTVEGMSKKILNKTINNRASGGQGLFLKKPPLDPAKTSDKCNKDL